MNFSEIVGQAWETARRETPWHSGSALLRHLAGGPAKSYREQLDEPKFNMYGERIPQIVLVRRNIARLGKPRRPPRLPA